MTFLLLISRIARGMKIITSIFLFLYLISFLFILISGELVFSSIWTLSVPSLEEQFSSLTPLHTIVDLSLIILFSMFLEKYRLWAKEVMKDMGFTEGEPISMEELEKIDIERFFLFNAIRDDIPLRKYFLRFSMLSFSITFVLLWLEVLHSVARRFAWTKVPGIGVTDVVLLALMAVIFWFLWNKTSGISEQSL